MAWSMPSNSQMIAMTVVVGILMIYYLYKTSKWSSRNCKSEYGDNRLQKMYDSKEIELILPAKLALVTDLDHTLLGYTSDCNQDIDKFNDIWCNEYAQRNCILIYATGRNLDNYCLAVQKWDIIKPDILVTQDGGCIYWFNKSLAHKMGILYCYDTEYEAVLSNGWNQSFVQEIHDEVYEKYKILKVLPTGSKSIEPFHLSILCKGKDLALQIKQYYIERVDEYNKYNKYNNNDSIEIHSFICMERSMTDWEHNDIYWAVLTPKRAGKGCAIEYIRKRLKLKEREIICVGDSSNDISMLSIHGYNSVVVGNASQELLSFYNTQKVNGNRKNIIKTMKQSTLGVIQGLQYYAPKLLKR